MKVRRTDCCVLAPASVDSANANSNESIFTNKGTKLYVAVVSLSAEDNQKLSKLLSTVFKMDIKRCVEIRKLTTSQGEDYGTWYLLDNDYIKSHYKLIAIDLSGQKGLDFDPTETHQIQFIGQLNNRY